MLVHEYLLSWMKNWDYMVKPIKSNPNMKIKTSQTPNQNIKTMSPSKECQDKLWVWQQITLTQTYKEMNWSLFKHPSNSRLWRPSVEKKQYLLTLRVWQTFLRQRFPWFFFFPFYCVNPQIIQYISAFHCLVLSTFCSWDKWWEDGG